MSIVSVVLLMGTDIHPAIEIREYNDWRFVAIPPDQRNYELFHALCGVRYGASEPFVDEPRGFPLDSDLTTTNHCTGDHSASWITLKEMGEHIMKVSDRLLPKWNTWRALMDYYVDAYGLNKTEPWDTRVRVVFNFDS